MQAPVRHCPFAPKTRPAGPITPVPTKHRRRKLLLRAASDGTDDSKSKDDSSKGKDRKDAAPKADFSAYWSMKFKEFFSNRRQYLEQANKLQDQKPEVLKKVEKKREEVQSEVQQVQQQRQQQRRLQEELRRGQEQELEQQLEQQMQPKLEANLQRIDRLVQPLLPEGALEPGPVRAPKSAYELGMDDVTAARSYVRSTPFRIFLLSIYQFRALMKQLVMAPITVPAKLHHEWQTLFASQRYENFLMAEGERIWYWRNRTENERWFWEMFVFERFLIPLAWTICYELIVPNNFIWAVFVPVSCIIWQTGRFPSPRTMEFWLILYFGFYMKCWPQFLGLVSMLFQWW